MLKHELEELVKELDQKVKDLSFELSETKRKHAESTSKQMEDLKKENMEMRDKLSTLSALLVAPPRTAAEKLTSAEVRAALAGCVLVGKDFSEENLISITNMGAKKAYEIYRLGRLSPLRPLAKRS